MIHFKNAVLRYGTRPILGGVTFAVHQGERIALVGLNGAGKTTLLRILAGQEQLESGEIVCPKSATIGYLPQEILSAGNKTLFEEAQEAFSQVLELQQRLDEAARSLKTLDTTSDLYADTLELIGELEHALEDSEQSKLKSRIERVLHGLGFAQADMQRRCDEFSGGWQMRIALAKLLLREPSLLMLDEPTNHLDIESVVWLEQYLKNYQGALILVSHDRRLLDSLCTRTLALSRGNLESYAGNYSYYEQQAAARRVQTEQAAKNQQRRIEKTERFIERFRAKNTKAAQVQSRIKALEKIERIEVQQDEARIAFRFPPVARSGQTVLELEAISKNYGEHAVLKNISLKIERGERVAIAGFNGAGKSTLVRIMAGALGYDAGQLRLGHNVTLSYFAQHQAEELNPELTALQEAEAAAPPGQQQRARDLLGTFLLSGDDALKRVSVLSGGEKNRLALAKMLLKPFNFLILDEPTNHLDMRSKAVLQQAIQAFEGTLVIVSHDRDFIDPLVNKVIEVSPRGLRTFLGNVSDYAESVSLEKSQPPAGIRAAPKTKSQQGVLSAKERRSLSAQRQEFLKPYKKRLAALEEKISKLETEQTELEARMADEDFYKDQPQFAAALKRYDALKTELTQTYADWETTGQQLEQAQTQAQEHA